MTNMDVYKLLLKIVITWKIKMLNSTGVLHIEIRSIIKIAFPTVEGVAMGLY